MKKVIIAGGGIAGLTAAVYLARKGFKVKLFEKNEKCGGLVNTFDYNGFRFEGGARALVNAGVITPMVEDLQLDVELLKNPVSVGVEDRIMTVNGEKSLLEYAELLKSKYPESQDDIQRLIETERKILEHMKVLYGIDNPLFSFNKIREEGKLIQMMGRYFLWFFKFLRTVREINALKEPVEKYAERIIKNRSLRDIVIQHFFRGTPSFFALSYFYLFNDYLYPKGGVGNFPESLAKKIAELGGEILLNNQIVKVTPGKNTVVDEKGNEHQYDFLIWATDLKAFYKSLDTQGVNGNTLKKIEDEKQKVLSARGAESVITFYFGVDEPVETFSKISTGHFFYTPSRQGLGEINRSKVKYLVENYEKLTKEEILQWLEEFIKFNTYEISIPALRDKSMAPDGKTGLIVSMLIDYDIVKKINDDGWYEEFKQKAEELITDSLTRTIYPFLEDKTIFKFTSTPLTIERMYGTSEGSIVGWSFEGKLPVPSGIFSMTTSVKTPIENIYKAGKWAYAPAGVPTAIITGKLASDTVIKNSSN
ncbi:MAG: NAD(P)/FAD-dependent oxidoreductase [Fervidobacterium sp.]|uniref:phytoene desaturase family protein n=1 Tax=Fervidobacterium TaxID=2422 RepID=UPI00309D4AEE